MPSVGLPGAGPSSSSRGSDAAAKYAAKYQEINKAYLASTQDLTAALEKRPADMKDVRAAVKKATGGYEERLSRLSAVKWPASVRDAMNDYIEVATTVSRASGKQMEDAQTVADVRSWTIDPEALGKVYKAEAKVQAKLTALS